MLLLLISLAAVPPVAVDVAGMAPQLSTIRRDAAERGWRVTCEGRSGEERIIRLAFPPEASDRAIRSYFGPGGLGSATRYYTSAAAVPAGCDQAPPTMSGSPLRVLAIGPRSQLAPLASLARACGFAGAAVRQPRRGDVPALAPRPHRDWMTLDAGEDAAARYGPAICFVQMRQRALSSTTAPHR